LLSKDLEEDRIHLGKSGVKVKGMAEVTPDDPGAVVGIGSTRNDSGTGRCLRSAKITEEINLLMVVLNARRRLSVETGNQNG
jgi:hypothetical protein